MVFSRTAGYKSGNITVQTCPSQLKESAWPHTASFQTVPYLPPHYLHSSFCVWSKQPRSKPSPIYRLIIFTAHSVRGPKQPRSKPSPIYRPITFTAHCVRGPNSLVPNRPYLQPHYLHSSSEAKYSLLCSTLSTPQGILLFDNTTFRELRTT